MVLDRIFTSHMVFPAGKNIRIYGEGRGKVKVTFAGVTLCTDTTENVGEWEENRRLSCEFYNIPYEVMWQVELPPMSYGGPYTLTVEFDDSTVVLEDIYVGKVFLFSGQSNMKMKLGDTDFPAVDYKSNDMIRLYTTEGIEKKDRFTPCDGWVKCNKDEASDWSAIAYLVSNAVQERDGVAVGAVVCGQGASVIESWVPNGAFSETGIDIPADKKHVDHTYEIYKEWNGIDGTLYEKAFLQVVPYAFSAVIWYQGESDTTEEEAEVYETELDILIDIWKYDLCDSELDFLIVQIADYDARNDEGWRKLQEAQARIGQKKSNVRTVISRNVCNSDNIHPKNKTELSARIAGLL